MAITNNPQLVQKARKMVAKQQALINEATVALRGDLSELDQLKLLDIIERAEKAIAVLEANIKIREA